MRNQLENIVAGEAITAPALVYFDGVDGKAYKASASTTTNPAQAILLVDCDADETGQAYLGGVVDYAFGEVPQATPLYLGDTAGEITSTAPANVQRVGFVIDSGKAFFSFSGFSGGGGIPLDNTGLGLTGYGGDFIWKSSPGDFESGLVWDSYMSTTTGDIFPYQGAFVWYSGASESNPRAFFQANGEEVYFQFGAESPSVSNGIVNATSSGIIIEGNDLVGGRNRNINVKNEATTSNTDFVNSDGGFDFQSTTGALIPPKMTSAQKEAIASPSDGMEVWDTDLDGKCVYDGVKWLRLSQKSAPTIAVGAGAGSGATVTVSGNDIEGLITLTGGTSATASATVLTLTFFDSFTTAPISVMISESNQNALLMPVGRKPGFDAVSTTTFTMVNASVNGIINGTVYKYTYRVIQ